MKRGRSRAVLLLAASFFLLPEAGSQRAERKSAAEGPGDPMAGKKVYRTHCTLCHFDTSAAVRVGPGLKGFFKLKTMPKSELPVTEENVRKIILQGRGDPAMPLMPAYKDVLTSKEMDDLLAYLKSL